MASTRREDRLSALPDGVLGDILSHLPTKEAARAAVLARRWRDVFGSAHSIAFSEQEGDRAHDWDTFYFEAEERKSCSAELLDDVSAALLCRRRCAGVHVPLRTFRFAFDKLMWWDVVHVDQWLHYALQHAHDSQGLHLDVSFCSGPGCPTEGYRRDYEEAATYVLPRRLFSCTAMRTLAVARCALKLPPAVHLPSLETLRLTALVEAPDLANTVQRLVACCPCLADLTLEALPALRTVAVLDKRLRRLSVRCCHNLVDVAVDASELTCLDYRGAAPPESLLSLRDGTGIASFTVDLCEPPTNGAEFHRLRKLLEKLSGSAKHLHLHHANLNLQSGRFADSFPWFPVLRRLVLQGSFVPADALRGILEQTPSLEVLSLYMEQEEPTAAEDDPRRRHGGQDERYKVADELAVPGELESSFSTIPCLRRQLREVNMVHYQGTDAHRTLAYLLFRNALLLTRLCVVFPEGPLVWQAKLKNEMEGWAAPDSEKIFL